MPPLSGSPPQAAAETAAVPVPARETTICLYKTECIRDGYHSGLGRLWLPPTWKKSPKTRVSSE